LEGSKLEHLLAQAYEIDREVETSLRSVGGAGSQVVDRGHEPFRRDGRRSIHVRE
jgi:hypothetical protein